MKPDVSIVSCADYAPEACRAALTAVLEPLGGLDWVKAGMRVAVKANLVAGLRPEHTATTHPELLAALAELLRERGAQAVVGDSPGGLYNAAAVNRIYRLTGMERVERAGGLLNQNFSQKQASFPAARVAKEFEYTAWLDGCDAIIDFCKLKSHGMMALSAAAKNLFGTIPGTRKPEYHYRYPDPRDFARMLVDLNEYWKPRLCIVDAVVTMEGNGPTAGTPRPMGALLAGENPHALDLACAHLVGLRRADVPTLEAALERGLIPPAAEQLTVAGDLERFVQPDFQRIETKNDLLFRDLAPGPLQKLWAPLVRSVMASRPKVKPEECVGCGSCERVCPAHALRLHNGLPHIDRSRCIRCFCCQEFCPKGALKVVRSPIARLLSR